MSGKRLYRSRDNRVIAGVCGGLADYLNVDATMVRVVTALVTLFGGSGILAYIILWIVVPEAPGGVSRAKENEQKTEDEPKSDSDRTNKILSVTGGHWLVGTLLVVVGVMLLLNNLLPALELMRLWPLAIIIFGVWLLMKKGDE